MAKQAAVYVRVSTLDQEKGKDSQRRALKSYCKNHSIKDYEWYVDKLSGANTKRPAFMRMQKDIFNGKVDTIVVWSLDRITRRGVKEGLDILIGWLDKKIRVVSVNEQLDFSGAMGELLASVFFAIARMQREALRENTKRGLKAAVARGSILGKRPRIFAKDIVKMIEKGFLMEDISTKLRVTKPALYLCLERGGIDLKKLRRKLDVA